MEPETVIIPLVYVLVSYGIVNVVDEKFEVLSFLLTFSEARILVRL